MTDLDAKTVVINAAYDAILQSSNIILARCRKSLNILHLQEENPTLAQILAGMIEICDLMKTLSETHYVTFKAEEYIAHVRGIVSAVESNDLDKLRLCVNDLNRRSFL